METSGSTCFRSRAGGARTEAASLIAQTQFATLHGVVNQLYYGDNLQVLREHVADESVDLIYLDPRRASACRSIATQLVRRNIRG